MKKRAGGSSQSAARATIELDGEAALMTMKTLGTFVFTLALVCGPAAGPLTAAGDDASLYDRLGGKPAVTAVASGLVDRILQDSRVNGWFVHAAASPENAAAYKSRLYDFVCQATGGPCKYTGLDMVTAHRGRRVTSAAFDAVVEDLVAVLDALRVPAGQKNELLGVLAPLKSSIVQP